MKPEDREEGGADEPWTVKTQRHIADGFAVYVKCDDQRFYEKPHVYTGENAAEVFIDYVLEKATEIRNIYRNKISAIVSADERIAHDNAEHCYLCHGSFVVNKNDQGYLNKKKVLDHCYLTGKYRGAAHSICNLQLRSQP